MNEATRRQIRSYHQAFNVEKMIYTLGKDVQLHRPIHVRWVAWTAGIELLMVVLFRVAGVTMAIATIPWGFAYLAVPIGVGWLLKTAKVEGRLFHVAAIAWAKHLFYGRHLVGGCRRLSSRSFRPVGPTRIRVSPVLPIPRRRPRRAVVALPATAITIILVLLVVNATRGGTVGAASAGTSRPTTPPVLPVVISQVRTKPSARPVHQTTHSRHSHRARASKKAAGR